MDLDNLFERISEEAFWEIVNDEDRKSRLHNKEWNKYNKICGKAMKNNKLQYVLEEHIPTAFSEEDSKDLIKYRSADIERQVIENKAMFKAGFRYAYFFLKQMEIIKDDDKSDLSV